MFTIRAYSGINVAQYAIVAREPSQHTLTEGASNLLNPQFPRTLSLTRFPMNDPSNNSMTDTTIYSCSRHTG